MPTRQTTSKVAPPCAVARSRPAAWVAAVALALSIGLLYGRAIDAPFIFDDSAAITENVSILSLWPLIGTKEHRGPLNPDPELPTSARPLVNLSFALNYYFGGLQPVGYHIFNVIVHFFSAMLLWAIIRRTLRLTFFGGRFEQSAGWVALVAALLWALHPLQTETVIYSTQRTELMMAFFYLATLYCSLRYWTDFLPQLAVGKEEHTQLTAACHSHRVTWLTLAVLSCLCGMASKEVMVSAPLMVLLFERTFIAGSLEKAIRRSWPLYIGLAATWLLLLGLTLATPRGASAGFGLGVPAFAWWLTQTKVFLMYLKLIVYPSPLLIHYQSPYLTLFAEAWMYVVPVVLLAVVTLVLLWRNSPVGYLLTFVFAILSPTFVIPIVTEMAAERRMYLPLAAILVLLVLGIYRLAEILSRKLSQGPKLLFGFRPPGVLTALPALSLALVFGVVSANRLSAYYDEAGLWRDVLRRQPDNYMAHDNLGYFLHNAGRIPDAVDEFRAALSIRQDYASAQSHLGMALAKIGHSTEAIEILQNVLRKSNDADAHNNLGHALMNAGRLPEAVEEFTAALALNPNYPAALNNLGVTLSQTGHLPEAIEQLQHAVRVQPNKAETHNNLAMALLKAGRMSEAIEEFKTALALKPDDPAALNNLAIALSQTGRLSEAIEYLQHALNVQPNHAKTHNNLAMALLKSGRVTEAIDEFHAALQLKHDDPVTLNSLGMVLAQAGRLEEAIEQLGHAVRVRPEYVEAHVNLGTVLARSGKVPEAIEQLQLALKLNPNEANAHFNLGVLLSDTGEIDKAIAQLEEAVRLRPNYMEAHFSLGDVLARAGKTEPATEQYRAALRINPLFLPAYSKLAQVLARSDRSEEAITAAEQGVEVARRGGQASQAEKIEQWLSQYRAELQSSGNQPK
jgi:tetratricopeptide (TPR) repeat protein